MRALFSLSFLCLLCVALLLAMPSGCGGSGGSSGSKNASFGLKNRVAVTALAFPSGLPQPDTLTRVNAFPNLSFSSPVFLTSPGDGTNRICVVERRGTIHIFPNSENATATTVYLDIQSRVNSGGEEGLLGLAFDPNYALNGFFYVHYTASSPRRSVIARFQVTGGDPDLADPGSESVLFAVAQPYSNHNGGMLAFGPDGMLYGSFGDGGSGGDPGNNGQDLAKLLGKIFRVQPEANGTYSIPADNPLVGQNNVAEEIWALGLRHPWRFSFDRQDGDCWVGDVGQSTREEISIATSGANLGWRVFEGTRGHINPNNLPRSTFTEPIYDYGHGTGTAVIGGYVYRGANLPSLRGAYIYGDNGSGRVWALVHDNLNFVSNIEVSSVGGLSSFGEDENGELHAVSLGGTIYRFEESNPNPAPDFPQLLSQTGIFSDTAQLIVADGLIEYNVNAPLWSDGAVKYRWIALPGQARITFDPTDAWSFPLGTVLVKHFELEMTVGDPASAERLETRVFIHEENGWAGYTYRWNANQTDADLLTDAETAFYTINDAAAPGGQRTQEWRFPSRAQCMNCHTQAAGYVLGVRTRQLNRDFPYPEVTDNQLRSWNHIDLFTQNIGSAGGYDAYADLLEPTASLDDRVRAYLAVNCANCHRPGGPTPVTMDLGFDVAEGSMGIFDVRPTTGDLGLLDAYVVRPGSKESSVLWERMRRLDTTRMPPLGSTEVDTEAVQVIGDWIDMHP